MAVAWTKRERQRAAALMLLDAMDGIDDTEVLLNVIYTGLSEKFHSTSLLDDFANRVGRMAHENARMIDIASRQYHDREVPDGEQEQGWPSQGA